MNYKCFDHQALESLIDSQSSESKKVNFVFKLSQLYHQILESVIAVNELKIYSLKNKSGSLWIRSELTYRIVDSVCGCIS